VAEYETERGGPIPGPPLRSGVGRHLGFQELTRPASRGRRPKTFASAVEADLSRISRLLPIGCPG
jgi:hypothetical protein